MTLQSTIGSMLLVSVAACAGAVEGMNPASAVSKRDAPAKSVGPAPRSMCAAQETVLFSCETQAGKHASLCTSADVGDNAGYVYYAYGSPAQPEFVFPPEKRPPRDFRRTQLGFAGSAGGYAYSFENDGYRYIVYSLSGKEGLEDQGVLVTRGDPRTAVAALSCRKGSLVEDDGAGLLDLTLGWPVDPDLDRHGLPKRD